MNTRKGVIACLGVAVVSLAIYLPYLVFGSLGATYAISPIVSKHHQTTKTAVDDSYDPPDAATESKRRKKPVRTR